MFLPSWTATLKSSDDETTAEACPESHWPAVPQGKAPAGTIRPGKTPVGPTLAARIASRDRTTRPEGRRARMSLVLFVLGAGPMKGVLLAGGTGSRLHPLTRITNKHLLPIYDRPMIAYAIEALVKAGINELMVVTGGAHAGEFLRLLSNGEEHGIGVLSYAYQDRPGGIAEALGLAARFVGDDRVLVMLADNVFGRTIRPTVERFSDQAMGARILLAPVTDPAHLRHLGVPELTGDGRVARIVEKPESPPSHYCVTGVYCYGPDVFEVISTLAPSARGELEITDVNNHYVEQGLMSYDVLDGFWGDAGESIDAYYAVNDHVRRFGANSD